MAYARLSDLDELLLQVRAERSRGYLSEAIRSYNAGAIRASIILTWVAVVVDIVEKLKELEITGDAKAREQIAKVDNIHTTGDTDAALEFERKVLELALNDFELLSQQDYQDLERLRLDRHRCAHPSLSSDEPYEPAPELARFHIQSVVSKLLQHPPVQGRAALARLFAEVSSEYFPTSADKALEYLKDGPLGRPKDVLVRNFAVATTKVLLTDEFSGKKYHQKQAALSAARTLHRALVETAWKDMLSTRIREMKDEHLKLALMFLTNNEGAWTFLDSVVRTKLQDYVRGMAPGDLSHAHSDALSIPELREHAVSRLSSVTNVQLGDMLSSRWWDPPQEYTDLAVKRFSKANSWETANEIAKLTILPYVADLTEIQVEAIVKAVGENKKLVDAIQTEKVFEALADRSVVPREELLQIMTRHGVDEKFERLVRPNAAVDKPL